MDIIYIHEVGPRDGLQVEDTTVPLEEKIRWVEGLLNSGIDIIQLGSLLMSYSSIFQRPVISRKT